MASPDWKPVLAALGNEAARTVFAYAALGRLDPATRGELNSRERKAVQAWLGLGVLVEDDDGSLTVDGAALRAALTPPEGEAAGKARSGVGKFLDGPRITAMPASPAERTELLTWVRDHALGPGEVLTESELNHRLRVFHPDVAMIRRYLVDESLLERTPSGTEYAIAEDAPDH
jgi:hypothetical protein